MLEVWLVGFLITSLNVFFVLNIMYNHGYFWHEIDDYPFFMRAICIPSISLGVAAWWPLWAVVASIGLVVIVVGQTYRKIKG